ADAESGKQPPAKQCHKPVSQTASLHTFVIVCKLPAFCNNQRITQQTDLRINAHLRRTKAPPCLFISRSCPRNPRCAPRFFPRLPPCSHSSPPAAARPAVSSTAS